MFYHAWLRDPHTRARKGAKGRQLMVDSVYYGTGPDRWPTVGAHGVPSVNRKAWAARLWQTNRSARKYGC